MGRPKLARWPASPLAVATIRVYACFMIVYGLSVVIMAPERWSAPVYTMANRLGGKAFWGTSVLLLGTIALVGSLSRVFGVRNIGLYGCAVWAFGLAFAAASSAVMFPNASWGGSLIFAVIGVNVCVVARAEERRRRQEERDADDPTRST